MQITVQGLSVTLDTNIVGYELDNLYDTINLLIVDSEGNPDIITPQEQQWTYNLVVYMTLSKSYQIIQFEGEYPNLTATLTSDQLPINGRYVGQFEMTNNNKIAHTEQFEFWVENTLNPANAPFDGPTID